jgi:hypothetical protein
MIEIAEAVALGLVASPALLVGRFGFLRWRAGRRNRDELCGDCGEALYRPPAYATPALVEGRMVCGACGARGRRRMKGALVVGGALSALALGVATGAVFLGVGGWALPALVAAQYGGAFGGALLWMRRKNRVAIAELPAAAPGWSVED